MYYKIINGRMVIDSCKTIRTEGGMWISNPTEEQIASEGWLPYVPPEVEPVKTTEPEFEQVVNAVKKMFASSVSGLTDEEALEVAAIYPTWVSVIGKPVNVGERYWFNEKLYSLNGSNQLAAKMLITREIRYLITVRNGFLTLTVTFGNRGLMGGLRLLSWRYNKITN